MKTEENAFLSGTSSSNCSRSQITPRTRPDSTRIEKKAYAFHGTNYENCKLTLLLSPEFQPFPGVSGGDSYIKIND